MRIPVFARRANPCVDRPILRKSESYANEQIQWGRATWVDPEDPRKGIICREVLYFGERLTPPAADTGNSNSFVVGVKFQPPKSAIFSTIPRTHYLLRNREIYGDWQLSTSLLPANQSA